MRKKAAALAYKEFVDSAPRVVAKGEGLIARAIISKAEEFKVPLFCNAELVDSLVKMEVSSTVPQELYQAVVDIFVWLQRTEGKASLSSNR